VAGAQEAQQGEERVREDRGSRLTQATPAQPKNRSEGSKWARAGGYNQQNSQLAVSSLDAGTLLLVYSSSSVVWCCCSAPDWID